MTKPVFLIYATTIASASSEIISNWCTALYLSHDEKYLVSQLLGALSLHGAYGILFLCTIFAWAAIIDAFTIDETNRGLGLRVGASYQSHLGNMDLSKISTSVSQKGIYSAIDSINCVSA